MNLKDSKNMEKEDRMLLANIEDKIRQSEDRYMITFSSFLDLRQRSLAETVLKTRKDLNYGFYGGYENAERVICAFFPEGFLVGESAAQHFSSIPGENPLSVIRALRKKGSPELSHRDYLGALMGLGIRREAVGDILVREDGADLIVLKEMAGFVLMNYGRAGRAVLELSEIPVGDLIWEENAPREIVESVASLRLDNLVSVDLCGWNPCEKAGSSYAGRGENRFPRKRQGGIFRCQGKKRQGPDHGVD